MPIVEGEFFPESSRVVQGAWTQTFNKTLTERKWDLMQKGFECIERGFQFLCTKDLPIKHLRPRGSVNGMSLPALIIQNEDPEPFVWDQMQAWLDRELKRNHFKFYQPVGTAELIFNSDFLKVWDQYQKLILNYDQVIYQIKYQLLQGSQWSLHIEELNEPILLQSEQQLLRTLTWVLNEEDHTFRYRVELVLKKKPATLLQSLMTTTSFLR